MCFCLADQKPQLPPSPPPLSAGAFPLLDYSTIEIPTIFRGVFNGRTSHPCNPGMDARRVNRRNVYSQRYSAHLNTKPARTGRDPGYCEFESLDQITICKVLGLFSGRLGRGLINAQPQPDRRKLDQGKVVRRQLVVAGRHSPTMLILLKNRSTRFRARYRYA